MILVTLKNDVQREVEKGTTIAQVARALGGGLYKAACAAKVNGKLADLRTVLEEDCCVEILTFDDEYGQKAYWHTTSHIMAQAVRRLYPSAALAIGPSISAGFYYDFDLDASLTPENLERISEEMKKIIKEDLPIERFELSPSEAVKFMQEQGQKYKVELIREHAENGEAISFYRQGEFVDLCAGPHLLSTGRVKDFKLTSNSSL